jgi:hypothetical protein
MGQIILHPKQKHNHPNISTHRNIRSVPDPKDLKVTRRNRTLFSLERDRDGRSVRIPIFGVGTPCGIARSTIRIEIAPEWIASRVILKQIDRMAMRFQSFQLLVLYPSLPLHLNSNSTRAQFGAWTKTLMRRFEHTTVTPSLSSPVKLESSL